MGAGRGRGWEGSGRRPRERARLSSRPPPTHLPNPFPAAPPRRLEHDRVPDAGARGEGVVHGVHARRRVDVGRDDAVARPKVDRDPRPRPRDGGHARRLRHDGRPDLVAQRRHGGRGRAEEADAARCVGERRRQLRLFRRVPPPRPHRVHVGAVGDLDDEGDVGVVVVVGPGGEERRWRAARGSRPAARSTLATPPPPPHPPPLTRPAPRQTGRPCGCALRRCACPPVSP